MQREIGILCGIKNDDLDSYKETVQLAKTASVNIVETIIQNRFTPDATYYIGKGKAEDIKRRCIEFNASAVIFNNNLRPNQQRNLEDIIGKKIIDRCMLILDIFAQHARTTEGKLQVELAQLIYLLPRLSGKGSELSQLGGGIGTRGPGETKLEIDKRKIRDRIEFLKAKLEVVRVHRKVLRESRKAKGFLNATLVGYTNAGKSTLLNVLTKSDVLVENKLFSTLDPTTRKIYLPSKNSMLLTDTVGFIRNLPSELVTSFRATLEEIAEADIIIMLLDAERLDLDVQLEAVYRELKELNVLSKPIITVLNKIDMVPLHRISRLKHDFPEAIFISAGKKIQIEHLISKISLLSNELLTKNYNFDKLKTLNMKRI
jgi:GTP-binding protein HflX